MLMETPLSELIRQVTTAAAGKAGIKIDLEISGECQLPADHKVAIYRIAQEALNNLVKHARADKAMVKLICTISETNERIEGRNVVLTISDNGKGFHPDQIVPRRMGLKIMKERAADIGGKLEINSSPGAGTEIKLVWNDK